MCGLYTESYGNKDIYYMRILPDNAIHGGAIWFPYGTIRPDYVMQFWGDAKLTMEAREHVL